MSTTRVGAGRKGGVKKKKAKWHLRDKFIKTQA